MRILSLRVFEHRDVSIYSRADIGTFPTFDNNFRSFYNIFYNIFLNNERNKIKTNIVYVSKTRAVHLHVHLIYSYWALVLNVRNLKLNFNDGLRVCGHWDVYLPLCVEPYNSIGNV